MFDILIKNGTVVTQNDKREILKTNIGITDGIIKYVGKEEIVAKEVIDARDYIVVPGYLNSHIHFGEYYLRGYKKRLTTEEYICLGEKFHKELLDLNDQIRSSSIDNVIYESIKNGSLTLFGVRGWPNANKFPINAFLGYPIMKSDKLVSYLSNFEKEFLKLKKEKNVEYFIGLHSVKWIDEKLLIRLSKFFKKNKDVKLSVHICETVEEVEYIKNKYKMTPVELLNKYNLLNQNVLLVHCNYLEENDLILLKENNVSVAVCHTSNLKLKNRPCDIEKLLSYGINVTIATDGPATNDSLSLLETLKISALISNIEGQKLFDMITLNPAKYMKINCGSIVKNNKADLLFYYKNGLNITYNKSIINNLIYLPANNPKIIMKDGNIIINDYKFINNIDKDIVLEKNRIVELLEDYADNNM